MAAGKIIAQSKKLADLGWEAAKPQLKIFARYAAIELVPPYKPSEIIEIPKGVGWVTDIVLKGSWKQWTVREAWLYALVGTEIGCWFFVGECIGKRHIVGYVV